ncbi:hypothetical protein ACW6QP_00620 [Salegentibacter sp. HM20]
MKKQDFNFKILFIIWALLAVFGQQSFAFSSPQFIQDEPDRSYFQTEQNFDGILLREFSVEFSRGNSETSSEYNTSGTWGNFTFRLNTFFGKQAKPVFYLPDHRANIHQQIFPFHFFW